MNIGDSFKVTAEGHPHEGKTGAIAGPVEWYGKLGLVEVHRNEDADDGWHGSIFMRPENLTLLHDA